MLLRFLIPTKIIKENVDVFADDFLSTSINRLVPRVHETVTHT